MSCDRPWPVLGSERAVAALGAAQDRQARGERPDDAGEHGHGGGQPLSGRRAHASVAFGQWDANPARPLDRQPAISDRFRNVHKVLPFEVEIDAGGAVSFMISGLHQVVIYDDGTALSDVQQGTLLPGMPPLIDWPTGRIYRGLDPRTLHLLFMPIPQTVPSTPLAPLRFEDRVESVHFPESGTYLVVCGVQSHFVEGMHGFVTVKKGNSRSSAS